MPTVWGLLHMLASDSPQVCRVQTSALVLCFLSSVEPCGAIQLSAWHWPWVHVSLMDIAYSKFGLPFIPSCFSTLRIVQIRLK